MREKYESLALIDLKAIAKSRGIKGTSTMKKAEVVEAMLQLDEEERQKEKSLQEEEKEMNPVQRQERAALNKRLVKAKPILQLPKNTTP